MIKFTQLFFFCSLLAAFGLSACATYSAVTPPVPLTPGTTDDCSAACENLRARHCPAGDPTLVDATGEKARVTKVGLIPAEEILKI